MVVVADVVVVAVAVKLSCRSEGVKGLCRQSFEKHNAWSEVEFKIFKARAGT